MLRQKARTDGKNFRALAQTVRVLVKSVRALAQTVRALVKHVKPIFKTVEYPSTIRQLSVSFKPFNGQSLKCTFSRGRSHILMIFFAGENHDSLSLKYN